ncbi:uncharacterized protein LOC132068503 isoform X2 [Lycium ferocissimum]|uniref:uncharacterized protein LOC132068503 isoform X2 n=1 Tax=Lycium ferocissimum TaxID=112874 RepID=UPI0028154CAC|nr:uncharacterized protein LOC132068503 isoform X2 [Lycium ferocissimum]
MIVAFEKGKSLSLKEKQFLYDIVANGRNGIDVDKFDYSERDTRAYGLRSNWAVPIGDLTLRITSINAINFDQLLQEGQCPFMQFKVGKVRICKFLLLVP